MLVARIAVSFKCGQMLEKNTALDLLVLDGGFDDQIGSAEILIAGRRLDALER